MSKKTSINEMATLRYENGDDAVDAWNIWNDGEIV